MEQAELYIDAAQYDQEAYPLDLDVGADADELDFHLDGVFDTEAQHHGAEAGADDSAEQTADFEIGFDDEDPEASGLNEDLAGTELVHDASGDMGMQYGDEIGYEDEEVAQVDDSTYQELAETAKPDPASEQHQEPREHDEQTFDFEGDVSEITSHEVNDEDLALHEAGEDIPFQGATEDAENGTSTANLNGNSGTHIDNLEDGATHVTSPEDQEYLDTAFEELGQTEGNSSDSSPSLPDIAVYYNEVRYSLFGAPADDPDSYFLSDSKELDSPLHRFLASIRTVIADEISPHDELMVRIDALSFEFGEKSSEQFLRRTFREILDCYNKLSDTQSSAHPSLVLHLVIRPDCEQRFAELLETAGISAVSSHPSDHSEVSSEDLDSSMAIGFEEHADEELSAAYYAEEDAPNEEQHSTDLSHADAGDATEEEQAFEFEMDDDGESNDLEDLSNPQPGMSASESGEGQLVGADGEDSLEQEYTEGYYEEDGQGEGQVEGYDTYAEDNANVPEAGDEFAGDVLPDHDLPLQTSESLIVEQGTDANGAAAIGGDEPDASTAGAGPDMTADFHGKHPSFLSPVKPTLPNKEKKSTVKGFLKRNPAEDLIDYSDDETPVVLFLSNGKRKASCHEEETPAKIPKAEHSQEEVSLGESDSNNVTDTQAEVSLEKINDSDVDGTQAEIYTAKTDDDDDNEKPVLPPASVSAEGAVSPELVDVKAEKDAKEFLGYSDEDDYLSLSPRFSLLTPPPAAGGTEDGDYAYITNPLRDGEPYAFPFPPHEQASSAGLNQIPVQTINRHPGSSEAPSAAGLSVEIDSESGTIHDLVDFKAGLEVTGSFDLAEDFGAQGTSFNQFHSHNDITLSLDQDPAVTSISTLPEPEISEENEYAQSYDETDNGGDHDTTHEPESGQRNDCAQPYDVTGNGGGRDTTHEPNQGINVTGSEIHAATTQQTTSTQSGTTSTVDGDEIDYEDQPQQPETLEFEEDTEGQDSNIGDENDEIDWGNDGDEDDTVVQEAAAPSPASISGKRGRTDEAEGLVDEADHKRRRT
ncbi:hypothetical protein B0H66DRAFT_643039 [Apodospora peruviana]|uniref:Uncharacterized protein n=1 Tax=Apodospora peruviana TaxID=516989 RepID=A0AAE0HV93_9PEZI|nr:hypothetical protein B0H66DRAFT_643039 [Apodospora peruviana]